MKSYLIIGGSSGIGLQLVKQLATKGHKVYATYNNNKVENSLENVSYHKLNVLENDLNLDFLPEKLDGFVYCPGSINLMPFRRIDANDMLHDYNLQVVGAFKIIQQIFTRLRKSGNASIVLFSTVAVQNGFKFHSQVSASKGAVEGLSKSLAAEFAPHVRVNCIAPSLTKTPLAEHLLNTEDKIVNNANRHPLKKIGSVSDIADLTEFLLSDKSSWITGQVMKIDGGISTLKL